MLGMIEPKGEEGIEFCVINNRTKGNLLYIIKDNKYSYFVRGVKGDEREEKNLINDDAFKRRIYFDYFLS